MIIDATNETIEILLGATVAANQATFACGYNSKTSAGLVPVDINGATNNTTPVTIVSSPASSGDQNQVRSIVIENNDTASITLTVRYNNTSMTRTLFKATLQTGENLVYTAEKGWQVLDSRGNEETNGIHINPVGNINYTEFFAVDTSVATVNPATVGVFTCLGRSTKANPTVNILHEVTVAGTTSITWAEIGMYIISIGMSPNNQNQWERVATSNQSAVWNTTGIKNTSIALTNVVEGDVLFPLFGFVSNPNIQFRGSTVVDQTFTGFQAAINTISSWRPTTQFYLISSNYTNAAAGIRVIYQLT